MKIRLLLATMLGAVSLTTQAAQTYHPAGSNLTWGEIAQHQDLLSYSNNPATGASVLAWGNGGFGMGIWSSFGVGVDVGPFGTLTGIMDEFTSVQNEMQNFLGGSNVTDINLDIVETLFTSANNIMETASEALDINIGLQTNVPMFPLVITHKSFGSVILDANLTARGRIKFLDSPIASNPLINPITGITDKFYTNSALYTKIAQINDFNLSYGRQVWNNDKGKLFAGVRASLYMGLVNKTLLPAVSINKAESVLQDQLDEANSTGSPYQWAFGLDASALWITDHYRLGATLKNITMPSFEYNTVGVNCERDSLSADSRTVCYQAQAYAGELDLTEKYTMIPQINLEAALYSKSRNWVVAGALETNSVSDPVGKAYQWASISTGYASPYVLLPGIRVGLRKNLAGSGLGYLTTGFTWLFITADVAVSFETVELPEQIQTGSNTVTIDPTIRSLSRRSFYANLGMNYVW
ncbi:MAG: conjugal transfer protein TraF [Gammaproteobacteria bacterium]|nr:conjugal transfer protein TraF [Gammaproteobacteria bacterium]